MFLFDLHLSPIAESLFHVESILLVRTPMVFSSDRGLSCQGGTRIEKTLFLSTFTQNLTIPHAIRTLIPKPFSLSQTFR